MKLRAADSHWMALALARAQHAASIGEVPVGAVLVRDGECLAAGYNHPISACDPTLHAEIHALRLGAQAAGNYRLPGTTLYVTIEPCTMCIGAIIHARVARVVFGAREPRAGAVVSRLQLLDQSHYNHRIEWGEGVMAAESAELMRDFFRSRR
ncbi:MAG: tRNA adenosine(34) deaminase TadA [Bacteroidales bacterium]|nr:tRNA adenosine(34) deaminase TadA [Bacteroidales bacterium]